MVVGKATFYPIIAFHYLKATHLVVQWAILPLGYKHFCNSFRNMNIYKPTGTRILTSTWLKSFYCISFLCPNILHIYLEANLTDFHAASV